MHYLSKNVLFVCLGLLVFQSAWAGDCPADDPGYGSALFDVAQTFDTGDVTTLSKTTHGGVLGDLNNDGYPDYVVFNSLTALEYDRIEVWLNDGQGGLSRYASFGAGGYNTGSLGDVDSDGDLDILSPEPGGVVWFNDGNANYGNPVFLEYPNTIEHVLLVDVNNDGNSDALTAQVVNGAPKKLTVKIWISNGNGGFSNTGSMITATSNNWIHQVLMTAGDVDGDNDLDLVITSEISESTTTSTAKTAIWKNNGSGGFTETQILARGEGARPTDSQLVDADFDGDLDLLLRDPYVQGQNTNTRARLWYNQGDGSFLSTNSVGETLWIGGNWPETARLVDLDNDCDLDAFISYQQNVTFGDEILLNDGNLHFVNHSDLGVHGQAVLGDLDNDQDVDAIILETIPGGGGYASVFNNRDLEASLNADFTADKTVGPTSLTVQFTNTSTIVATTITSWAWDFDGDGVTDSTSANPSYTYTTDGFYTVRLTVSDGTIFDTKTRVKYILAGNHTPGSGIFTLNGTWDTGQLFHNIDVADVDGDDDLDILVAGNPRTLWLNDGNGNLSQGNSFGATSPTTSAIPNAVSFGDIENDGDMDVWLAWGGSRNDELWRNDGSGNFSLLAFMGTDGEDVLMADVDGDGDVDALVSRVLIGTSQNGLVDVYLNEGAGSFVLDSSLDTQISEDDSQLLYLTLGDANNDGYKDLFTTGDDADLLWLADGAGGFTRTVIATTHDTKHLALGDMDGDGNLDAVFTSVINGSDRFARIFWGNGDGTFNQAAGTIGPSSIRATALADFDEDGDLDLFFVPAVNVTPNMALYLNDGSGNFTDSGQTLGAGGNNLIVADMDNDRDQDVLIWRYSFDTELEIWRNTNVSSANGDFTVNTTNDTVDANPGDGYALDSAGNTSLRAAVMEANALPGNDTIILPQGIYVLSLTGTLENLAQTGDLDITDDLTLFGDGADRSIVDGNGTDRVFHITGGVRFNLSNTGVRNGDATSSGTAPAQAGGGLFNNGNTHLNGVSVHSNSSLQCGGGIYNAGTLFVATSTIRANTAASGGGLADDGFGSMNVSNTTISGNDVSGNGGGIYSAAQVTLGHVTAVANSADNGGGLYNGGGTYFVGNTVVAGNTATSNNDVSGGYASIGGNFIGDAGTATGFTDGVNSNQVGSTASPLDAMLGNLADNGGNMLTHAPDTGSPLVDSALVNNGVDRDQLGRERPNDGDLDNNAGYDIGAIEAELPTIQLLSPNGAEVYTPGETVTISWQSTNFNGAVKLGLSLDGGATWQTIGNNLTGNSYVWTVSLEGSNTCVINVSGTFSSKFGDSSDAFFTILDPGFEIISPSEGQTLVAGAQLTITWTQTNVPGAVDLSLSRDGGLTWETLLNDYSGTSYVWPVTYRDPTDPNDPVEGVLRLNHRSISGLKDFTYGLVIDEPVLDLTSPDGGEILIPGTTHTITWTEANFAGTKSLKYSTDGGGTWSTIINGTTLTSYAWTVPNVPGTNMVVRIYADDVAQLKDTSAAAFTIATPVLEITSPNGGETLTVGQIQTITWNAANFPGSVSLRLSKDGGTSWQTIINNLTAGSYDWTIPSGVTSDGVVKIFSDELGGLNDTSDTVFSIVN